MKKLILLVPFLLAFKMYAQVDARSQFNTRCAVTDKGVDIAMDIKKPVYSLLVRIEDPGGRTVFLDHKNNFKGEYRRSADLKTTHAGKYLLTVDGDGKKFSEELIIK